MPSPGGSERIAAKIVIYVTISQRNPAWNQKSWFSADDPMCLYVSLGFGLGLAEPNTSGPSGTLLVDRGRSASQNSEDFSF